MLTPVSNDEVREAVYQLGGMKAPRPDGFSSTFYQSSWEQIGAEVCNMVKDIFIIGFHSLIINETDSVDSQD